MTEYCETWDMPKDGCAHCRGVSTVNLDRVTIPDAPTPESPGTRARTELVRRLNGGDHPHLARLLVDTAALYESLEDALTGVRSGEPGERKGSGGSDKPMPLQPAVAEHRHLLVRGLRYWTVAAQAAARSATRPSTGDFGTVPRMVAYIIGHLDALEASQRDELRSNLLDWQRGVHAKTDLPELRGSIPLPASCPDRAVVEGVTLYACTGTLRVMLPADKDRESWLQCDVCRRRWAVTDLPEAAAIEMPLSSLAALTGVSVRTLQYRVQNGSLVARAGCARLGDVLSTVTP